VRSKLYGGCLKISHLNCLSYVQVAVCTHALSCLPWTIDIISLNNLLLLYCHHTPQQSACEFQLDEHFYHLKIISPTRVARFCRSSLTNAKIQGKHTWHCYKQYMLPFTYRRWQEVHASSAEQLCAISSYFLDRLIHWWFGTKSLQAGSLQGTYVLYDHLFQQIGNVRLAWFQAYALMQTRSVLFWDFPQRRMVILYWCFSTTCLIFKGQAVFFSIHGKLFFNFQSYCNGKLQRLRGLSQK